MDRLAWQRIFSYSERIRRRRTLTCRWRDSYVTMLTIPDIAYRYLVFNVPKKTSSSWTTYWPAMPS